MRWKAEPRVTRDRVTDETVVTRFLWLPRRIGDEVRWLEVATYKREWLEWEDGDKRTNFGYGRWVATGWIDPPDPLNRRNLWGHRTTGL